MTDLALLQGFFMQLNRHYLTNVIAQRNICFILAVSKQKKMKKLTIMLVILTTITLYSRATNLSQTGGYRETTETVINTKF